MSRKRKNLPSRYHEKVLEKTNKKKPSYLDEVLEKREKERQKKLDKIWTDSNEKEFKKAHRNFINKIKRLEKKYPKIKAYLPEKVTYKEMKEMIQSKTDYNRELKALNDFTSRKNVIKVNEDGSYTGISKIRGTDNNLKITDWQKKQIQKRNTRINKKRLKEREKVANIEIKDRGKATGYTKGMIGMGKASDLELSPMTKYTRKMDYGDLREKYRVILSESSTDYWNIRNELLRINYLDEFEKHFNSYEGKDDMMKKIIDMDFDEFRKIFEANDGTFELLYPDEEQMDAYYERLQSIWMPNQ